MPNSEFSEISEQSEKLNTPSPKHDSKDIE